MATEKRGKHKHQREGRTTPHGAGERVIDATAAMDQEPAAESLRREPPVEYQSRRDDEPGVRKKIR